MKTMLTWMFMTAALPALASALPLTQVPWTEGPDGVAAQQFPREAVARLVHDVTQGEYVEGKAEGFRFVDLDGNGTLELVAWIDLSGRGHGRLFVISRTANGYAHASVPASYVDFPTVIRDVDEDGRMEIVLRRGLTPYGGGHARAAVSAVFVFSPEGLADRSPAFHDFYESVELPRISAALESARTLTADGDVAAADALEVERDKILRMTGGDANAGLTLAQEWSADARPRRREWAAVILGDIDSPEAWQVLAVLATDADHGVAEAARRAVKNRR